MARPHSRTARSFVINEGMDWHLRMLRFTGGCVASGGRGNEGVTCEAPGRWVFFMVLWVFMVFTHYLQS